MVQVTRSENCENSTINQRVEQIALALLGAGDLPDALLSEGAIWDHGTGAATGRAAIQAARAALPACAAIHVDQVVSHGKAGTASGMLSRPGQPPRLFCHVIRFTSVQGGEITQMVSFEHAGGKHGR